MINSPRKKLALTSEVLRTLSGSELTAVGGRDDRPRMPIDGGQPVPGGKRKTVETTWTDGRVDPHPTNPGGPRTSQFASCGIVCFPE